MIDWIFIVAGILGVAVGLYEIITVNWDHSEAYSLLTVIGWLVWLSRYFFK